MSPLSLRTAPSHMDIDISPVPRSREENQERAFIAASRRKDRSLDARIESANRASLLHKKRTGKALHITKEIVEKEAMYEEVDERYQEKRIRMLQAQNMQIEEEFHRHLLAAFAARANSAASSANPAGSRRGSALSARSFAAAGRKMSLDLSSVRNPFADAMRNGPHTSPLMPAHGFQLSPSTSYEQSSQSSSYVESPASSLTHGMPITAPQIPTYLAQTAYPTWPTPVPQSAPPFGSWHGFPIEQAGDTQSVESWQQSLMQDTHVAPDASSYHARPYRDRLASAPELALHGAGDPSPTNNNHLAWIPPPSQHTRVASDPASLATPGLTLLSSSGASSPKFDMVSTQTLSTPEFCPTPNTAYSPGTMKMEPVVEEEKTSDSWPAAATGKTADEDRDLLVSAEELDPDYDEFSRFAFGLGSNAQLFPQPGNGNGFGFDDIVTFDDGPTAV